MLQFKKLSRSLRIFIVAGVSIVTIVSLYLMSSINYLLFHTSAELFSIVIAFGLFLVAWNARNYSESTYLTYFGIAYLFIAVLDLLHTLSYKGIAIFPGPHDYATELWIATRYLESLTLVILLLLAKRTQKGKHYLLTILLYSLITAGIIVSIFITGVFPPCFLEGTGLTPFKIISEYIISALLAGAGVIIFLRRRNFEKRVYRFLFWSIVLTICSELAFTFYIDRYGLSNFVGHIFKVGSFYLIYKAIIETAFKKPVELLFQQLSRSNKEKDKLFSIIAHDLKNPFSGIKSSAELLLHDYDKLNENEIKDFIALIYKSARISTRLLDNLLLWARIQTGRAEPTPERCLLYDIVLENVELYSANAKKKNISVYNKIKEDVYLYADREMVELIVRNLLSNALKFTTIGGAVYFETVSARGGLGAAGVRSGAVSFSVRDTGVGISPEQLTKLFAIEKSKSTPGTQNEEGTGLGLILCKEFVEKNNGTITVQSNPGEGTTFTVTLPAFFSTFRQV